MQNKELEEYLAKYNDCYTPQMTLGQIELLEEELNDKAKSLIGCFILSVSLHGFYVYKIRNAYFERQATEQYNFTHRAYFLLRCDALNVNTGEKIFNKFIRPHNIYETKEDASQAFNVKRIEHLVQYADVHNTLDGMFRTLNDLEYVMAVTKKEVANLEKSHKEVNRILFEQSGT